MTLPKAFKGIRSKFALLNLLAFLSMAAAAGLGLRTMHAELMTARQDSVVEAVDLARGVVKQWKAKADAGKIHEAEAMEQAKDALRAMRFGVGKEYLFIYDLTGHNVMHPTKKEFEGQDRIATKDVDGVEYVKGFVEAAKAGGGFVRYRFPKAGQTEPSPKISYAAPTEAWGWIVAGGVYIDDINSLFLSEAWRQTILSLVVQVLIAVCVAFISRSVTKPLAGVTNELERMAAGELELILSESVRSDEIGTLARSVGHLRDKVAMRAREEAEASRLGRAEARREQMTALAQRLTESVGASVGAVAAGALTVEGAAEGLAKGAEETSMNATKVAAFSEQASAATGSVAAATEELSASVQEIARQVAGAAGMASAATTEAGHAKIEVEGLAEAAAEIAGVVQLISDISSQTNLLALNATIEAARAGEAGKGFAVVANEVKSLAAQTQRATDDIQARVERIRATSSSASAAIQAILRTIESLDQTTASVSVAVEEQGAATQDISRSCAHAASGSHSAAEGVGSVASHAGETRKTAASLQMSAKEMRAAAERLRSDIERFVSELRA